MAEKTKMVKVTKTEFTEFKKTVHRTIDLLGLKDWKVYVAFGKMEDIGLNSDESGAGVSWDVSASVATIVLSDHRPSDAHFHSPESAVHEELHLLLARLLYMATARYVHPEDIDAEEHRIIRVLEKVIAEQLGVRKK